MKFAGEFLGAVKLELLASTAHTQYWLQPSSASHCCSPTAFLAVSAGHCVTRSCPTLCNLMDCVARQAPLFMGILWARILEWVTIPSSMGPSQPRGRTQVSNIAGRFFTIRVTREAQESWSGEPILQGIFPTQELNQGLLHCRQILYQLSHNGSPAKDI